MLYQDVIRSAGEKIGPMYDINKLEMCSVSTNGEQASPAIA